ncbi:MAG: 30S ribosome-binding factor RbfA [Leptonema sp. (in: bacteria)]
MDPLRKKRLESLIRREVSEYILKEIRKKEDGIGLVSVTNVYISQDLSTAKIFFSLFSYEEKENILTWNILNKYRKKIQSDVSKKIRLRRTPQFIFVLDNSIKEGDRILEIIERTKKEND